MRKTLFDILSENYKSISVMDSLIQNITLILNARKGNLKHLPDYGLSEIEPYFQNKQNGQLDLAREIVDVLALYEKRIKISGITSRRVGSTNVFSYIIHAVDLALGSEFYLQIDVFADSKVRVKEYKD